MMLALSALLWGDPWRTTGLGAEAIASDTPIDFDRNSLTTSGARMLTIFAAHRNEPATARPASARAGPGWGDGLPEAGAMDAGRMSRVTS
jgi:hypothetical protein